MRGPTSRSADVMHDRAVTFNFALRICHPLKDRKPKTGLGS